MAWLSEPTSEFRLQAASGGAVDGPGFRELDLISSSEKANIDDVTNEAKASF